jgi:hypothetical protein
MSATPGSPTNPLHDPIAPPERDPPNKPMHDPPGDPTFEPPQPLTEPTPNPASDPPPEMSGDPPQMLGRRRGFPAGRLPDQAASYYSFCRLFLEACGAGSDRGCSMALPADASPCGRLRTGRCGSPTLHREGLSTPCRSPGALRVPSQNRYPSSMPAYPLPQVQPLSRRALRRLDKALFTEDAAAQRGGGGSTLDGRRFGQGVQQLVT